MCITGMFKKLDPRLRDPDSWASFAQPLTDKCALQITNVSFPGLLMCVAFGHLCATVILAFSETMGLSRFVGFFENRSYSTSSGGFFTAGYDDVDREDRDSKAPQDKFRVPSKAVGSREAIQ